MDPESETSNTCVADAASAASGIPEAIAVSRNGIGTEEATHNASGRGVFVGIEVGVTTAISRTGIGVAMAEEQAVNMRVHIRSNDIFFIGHEGVFYSILDFPV